MKKILLLIIASLMLFSSCGEKELSMTANEMAEIIEKSVPIKEGYYNPSEQYFSYYFKDTSGNALNVSDFIICRSKSQSSENEFGIIVAKSGNVNEIKKSCERYLEIKREAYLEAKASYSPDEYEKYRDAGVYVYGNTVIYLILTKNDAELVLNLLNDVN